MDAKLVHLVHLAENGDNDAQWELATAYMHGKGVSKNLERLKYYLIKIAQRPELLLANYYGGLISSIGDVCFDLRQFDEASEWYLKAIQYFLNSFPELEAQKLIEDYRVEKSLEDAFYWFTEYQNLPK